VTTGYRQHVSARSVTHGSYLNLIVHVVATIVLAVSAAAVAWVFLFTSATEPAAAHAHDRAAVR
jgi:hypothetical protein